MTGPTINKLFLYFAGILLLASCNTLNHLPPGEKLYTGAEIELVSKEKIKNKRKVTAAAKSALRPQPNASILGIRFKLWLYQKAQRTRKKKLKTWLEKKGEPPVLMSSVKPGQTASFVDAKLFNIGIFRGSTEYKTVEKEKTVKVIYKCHVHNPYTIKEVIYATNRSAMLDIIHSEDSKTVLSPGSDYSLESLKKERQRIEGLLKDNGYYFFDADYILFRADTSVSDRTVNLKFTFKDEAPAQAYEAYRINDVYIDPDYSLTGKRDSSVHTPLVYDSVTFTESETRIKPKVILQAVYLRKNSLYSRKLQNITTNRLMTLGTYKFVSVRFKEVDSTSHRLDMMVLLTAMPKRTLRAEGNVISKSNDFVGPQINVSYRNRNALNGAELLNLSLGGSFETQISGKYRNLFSYSFNPQIELFFPRFILPFNVKTSSLYVPKTKLSVGYSYLRRIGYFDLRSIQFTYGFKWKESLLKEHELNPVNINYTSIANRTPDFNALLESNPFIRKSYEEQFIAGSLYSFVYNEQLLPQRKQQFYLNLTTEVAGNAFTLAHRLDGRVPTEEQPLRVIGSVYSQFARGSVDLRHYSVFPKSKIVLRLYTGVGKPYGNSSTLPYIKQFFSGGPNSVRAFPINSLGPGTYQQQTMGAGFFLQQGGDIKLETNIEYRFDIWRFIKGAVFTDAGNVWLFKSDPALQVDPFSFARFYKEVAMGSGIGLRIDLSFFVLRFDLATPIRKPWLPEHQRWTFNQVNFGDPAWRSSNLVLNVAIGYPF